MTTRSVRFGPLTVLYGNTAVAVVDREDTQYPQLAGAIGRTPEDARRNLINARFAQSFGTIDDVLEGDVLERFRL